MRIDKIEWGKITIGELTFKDVKIFPGLCREWNWGETGTRHVPGIQVADLEELVHYGLTKMVLSRGYDLVLQTTDEAIQYLKDNNIEYWILQTEEAVKKYNELLEAGERVGALIHSTC